MTLALILWAYSLLAILFTTLALDRWRRGSERALVAALEMTALWALAVAGIGAEHVAARVMEGARDLACLWLAASLVRRAEPAGWTAGRRAAFVVAAAPAASIIVLALTRPGEGAIVASALPGLRLLAALAGLILLRPAARAEATERYVAAIAMLWGVDLVVHAPSLFIGSSPLFVLTRGVAMMGVGAAFALAAQSRNDRRFGMSRGLKLRVIAAAALMVYTAAVVAATGLVADWGGAHARAIQTAIVSGAAATLIALVSTPWLRAWMRVKVEKHLFGHRYDYRSAWLRFTGTLGHPGEDGPLGQRVVQAIADLMDAPAGLLLAMTEDGLESAGGWRWDGASGEARSLAHHLAATGRIVELDQVRRGAAPEDSGAVPEWMVSDAQAWAVAPLTHLGQLRGAILLARPPVARTLDWEDFDLLKLAGAQAASYLAEDRAHQALAAAQRFDEFNRRFAFILHDIKNLVSQITLVARNAERHADNPEFRADMVATLRDSAERMTTLVERLSHRAPVAARRAEPVDLAALALCAAHARRVQHPVEVTADGPILALADPGGIARALDHLIQNAVEASSSRAPVTISVRVDSDHASVEVADRGAGMSPAFVRDQLFRPFSSSKPGGFGLGAYEARQLVRGMGGELHVDSREGEGTRFRLLLPLAASLDKAA